MFVELVHIKIRKAVPKKQPGYWGSHFETLKRDVIPKPAWEASVLLFYGSTVMLWNLDILCGLKGHQPVEVLLKNPYSQAAHYSRALLPLLSIMWLALGGHVTCNLHWTFTQTVFVLVQLPRETEACKISTGSNQTSFSFLQDII